MDLPQSRFADALPFIIRAHLGYNQLYNMTHFTVAAYGVGKSSRWVIRRTTSVSSVEMTKQCRMCFSDIDARARKCPRCQMFQGVWQVTVPLIIALVPICFILALIWLMKPASRDMQDYSENITITESSLYLAPYLNRLSEQVIGKSPTVVGRLKNSSLQQLNRIDLQLQIFNEHNELIDICTNGISGSFVPGEEHAFKITGDLIHKPESEYSSHKVIVSSANSW